MEVNDPPEYDEYGEVLVYYQETEIYDIDYFVDGEWDKAGKYAHLLSHWMPLPEPPIVYGKEREE